MGPRKARDFLVDDYAPMRQSLRKLLEIEPEFEVCGEAATLDEGCEGILAAHPDVAIVDLVLARQTGLDLLNRLKDEAGKMKIPVLILSMHPEELYAELLLQRGARGYIMKTESSDQILAAIRKVLDGQIYLSAQMEKQLLKKGIPHE